MKSLDIVNQLKTLLPRYTSYFHDDIDVSSIAISDGVATITTSTPHNLTTGDAIVAGSYVLRNPITAVSSYGGSTTDYLVTTSIQHDQTKASFETKTVTLGGFTNSAWNGDITLVQAGRENFIVRFIGGNTTPTLNGNEYLEENRIDGINGQYNITVLNSTSFQLDTSLLSGTYSSGRMTSFVRVGVAYGVEQAIDFYTAQENDDYWLFVIMGEPTVSRDNSTITEANNDLSVGASIRINVIDGFEVLVLIPTSDYKSAGTAIDIARFELQPILHRCLLGVTFDTGLSSTSLFKTSFVSAQAAAYNNSFLGYIYEYEFQYLLTDDDAVEPSLGRAWRDFDYRTYVRENNEDFISTTDIPTISGSGYQAQDNIE